MIRVECRAAIRTNYDVLNSWFKMKGMCFSKPSTFPKKLTLNDINKIEGEDERLTCLMEYYFQNSKDFDKFFELNTSIIKQFFTFDELSKTTIDLMNYHFDLATKNLEDIITNSQGNKNIELQKQKVKRIRGPTVRNPFTQSKINKDGKTYKELELDKYYDFDANGVPSLKPNLPDKKYYKKRNKEYLEVKDKYNNTFYVEIENNNKKYFIDFETKK